MEKKWWHKSVIYQVYPRSFYDSNGDGIGDIRGIIEKLDYLEELGIDILWLSPVYKSPMDDNGYDISDYYSIATEFGTLEDMENLITEAKRHGIKIMMDIVVNHTSDEHPWFIESRSSLDNPKRNWYIWRNASPDGGPPNNWGSFFTRSAWEFDEKTGQYYLHLFSKKQPDLNWENSEVRYEIFKMIKWWIDKGIAGLRLDAINVLSKPRDFRHGSSDFPVTGMDLWVNGPEIHKYIREINEKVFSLTDVVTVGETSMVTPEIAVEYTSPERKELDMVFQFEHISVDSGESGKWDKIPLNLVKLKEIFSRWQHGLYEKGWNSLYWNNHDQPRVISRFGSEDDEYRELSAKMLATALHLMQGTPFIYQGEEIGMTNAKFETINEYNDIDTHNYYDIAINDLGIPEDRVMEQIGMMSRDNARTPMQWSSATNGGFTTGKPWLKVNPGYKTINAEEAMADQNSIFHYYKELIYLRKESQLSDIIVYGEFKLILESNENVFAYLRVLEKRKLLVICNFFGNTEYLSFPDEIASSMAVPVMSNYSDSSSSLDNCILRPYESMILELISGE